MPSAMHWRRPRGLSFLVWVCHIFVANGPFLVTVSSLSTNQPPNMSLDPQSDTVIHVGNLDWNLSIDDVSTMINRGILTNSKVFKNEAGPQRPFQVKIAQLSKPRRKRDEGKFHQGSAKIVFECQEDAQQGMIALKHFSEELRKDGKNELKVRWASMPKPKTDIEALLKNPDSLTPERLEHRKKRAAKYARKRRRVAQDTDRVIQSVLAKLAPEDRALITSNTPVLDANPLDWSSGPEEIDPMKGGRIRKGTNRGERKRAAVEAFLCVLQALLVDQRAVDQQGSSDRRVADLGCGGGNLTIPLSWWLKQIGFGIVGVDINAKALQLLSERATRLGIGVETLEMDLLQLTFSKSRFETASTNNNDNNNFEDAVEPRNRSLSNCAAVVSLHACGAASDLSMAVAVENQVPFAISPCCIGKISTKRAMPAGRMPPKNLSSSERSAAPDEITYPRSSWLQECLAGGLEDYRLLAAAADYGAPDREKVGDEELNRRKRCRLAKKLLEMDRLQWAKEQGYYIRLVEMPRIGPLYPKRELLLGAKMGSDAALILSHLSTTT